jgi:hypothetical protein
MRKEYAKIMTGKGAPGRNTGGNGSIYVGLTSKGPKLYAKYNNTWFETDMKRNSTTPKPSRKSTFEITADNTFRDIKVHNLYENSMHLAPNKIYIPWGSSATEGSGAVFSGDGIIRDTDVDHNLFIAPYGGILEKLLIYTVGGVGSSSFALNVNGIDGLSFDTDLQPKGVSIINFTSSNTFNIGDKLAIKWEAPSPYNDSEETVIVSVWKYNVA